MIVRFARTGGHSDRLDELLPLATRRRREQRHRDRHREVEEHAHGAEAQRDRRLDGVASERLGGPKMPICLTDFEMVQRISFDPRLGEF